MCAPLSVHTLGCISPQHTHALCVHVPHIHAHGMCVCMHRHWVLTARLQGVCKATYECVSGTGVPQGAQSLPTCWYLLYSLPRASKSWQSSCVYFQDGCFSGSTSWIRSTAWELTWNQRYRSATSDTVPLRWGREGGPGETPVALVGPQSVPITGLFPATFLPSG